MANISDDCSPVGNCTLCTVRADPSCIGGNVGNILPDCGLTRDVLPAEYKPPKSEKLGLILFDWFLHSFFYAFPNNSARREHSPCMRRVPSSTGRHFCRYTETKRLSKASRLKHFVDRVLILCGCGCGSTLVARHFNSGRHRHSQQHSPCDGAD